MPSKPAESYGLDQALLKKNNSKKKPLSHKYEQKGFHFKLFTLRIIHHNNECAYGLHLDEHVLQNEFLR